MTAVKKIPQRKCIGCNQMKNKKELIRILKTQDDEIVIDTTGKKNGRGIILLFSQSTMSRKTWQMCMHLLRKKAAA